MVLVEEICWRLLVAERLGRLATAVAGQPEIYPVNYACQPPTVLVRTTEGTKLLSAAINHRVAFEVDGLDSVGGWSVLVLGRARVLETEAEVSAAEQFSLRPWAPGVKERYLLIEADRITGRRFIFVTEPTAGPTVGTSD